MKIPKLRFLLPWFWRLVAQARIERALRSTLREMRRERAKAQM